MRVGPVSSRHCDAPPVPEEELLAVELTEELTCVELEVADEADVELESPPPEPAPSPQAAPIATADRKKPDQVRFRMPPP